MAVDENRSISGSSESSKNHESAVGFQKHADGPLGSSNKLHSIEGRSALSFCEGVLS
jgi:hypothetical protein